MCVTTIPALVFHKGIELHDKCPDKKSCRLCCHALRISQALRSLSWAQRSWCKAVMAGALLNAVLVIWSVVCVHGFHSSPSFAQRFHMRMESGSTETVVYISGSSVVSWLKREGVQFQFEEAHTYLRSCYSRLRCSAFGCILHTLKSQHLKSFTNAVLIIVLNAIHMIFDKNKIFSAFFVWM